MTIDLSGYNVAASRQAAAQQVRGADIRNYVGSAGSASAVVAGYTCTIDNSAAHCNCADWQRGQHLDRLCKHLIALAGYHNRQPTASTAQQQVPADTAETDTAETDAAETDAADSVGTQTQQQTQQTAQPVAAQPTQHSAPATGQQQPLRSWTQPAGSFADLVGAHIGAAITAKARELAQRISSDSPDAAYLLLGSSGTGKTSAINRLASLLDCRLEYIAGSDSYADTDLVGFANPHTGERVRGVVTRAFALARDGQNVLLFLDELFRFNSRALDILMRAVQPVDAETATRAGIPTTEPVYIVESPLWGREYAPASRIVWVAAANPWGLQPDPALVRRYTVLRYDFAASVLQPLSQRMRDYILATWRGTDDGTLPLAIEYQQISQMTDADDTSILAQYLAKLETLDAAAAMAARDTAAALGIPETEYQHD